jgi:hypothetical protein
VVEVPVREHDRRRARPAEAVLGGAGDRAREARDAGVDEHPPAVARVGVAEERHVDDPGAQPRQVGGQLERRAVVVAGRARQHVLEVGEVERVVHGQRPRTRFQASRAASFISCHVPCDVPRAECQPLSRSFSTSCHSRPECRVAESTP